MISEIVSNAACNANEISVRHLINISVNSEVQIFRGDTGAQVGDNFTVTGYDTATNSSRIRLDPLFRKSSWPRAGTSYKSIRAPPHRCLLPTPR